MHALLLRDFSATECTLSIRCSKGFFVRALADDLGRALGSGGALKSLRRTTSGPFTLDRAVSLTQLEALAGSGAEGRAQLESRLVTMTDALAELPLFPVSAQDVARVGHGVPLEVPPEQPPGQVRVVGPDGVASGGGRGARGPAESTSGWWRPGERDRPRSLHPPRRGGRQAQAGSRACPAGAGVGEVLQTLLTLYPKLRSAMASETRLRRQQLTVVVEPRSAARGLREGIRVWLFASAAASERPAS